MSTDCANRLYPSPLYRKAMQNTTCVSVKHAIALPVSICFYNKKVARSKKRFSLFFASNQVLLLPVGRCVTKGRWQQNKLKTLQNNLSACKALSSKALLLTDCVLFIVPFVVFPSLCCLRLQAGRTQHLVLDPSLIEDRTQQVILLFLYLLLVQYPFRHKHLVNELN